MHEASSVTKDFLLLSQPFINQGILIASASAGRRLYIHHLSEVPMNQVFLTRTGNHLQRTDRQTVKLAGTISLTVEDIPPLPVPSVKMTQAIPTSVFAGPLPARDETVLKLLHRGKQANGSGDFSTACACFEAAYALSVRAGMLVSAANMRLKLHQPATAAAMYRYVLAECELLPAEKDMASRKLAEAQAALKSKGIEGASPGTAPGRGARRESAEEGGFASFAAFGFEDGGSDDGSDRQEQPSGNGGGRSDGAFGGVFDSAPARSSFGDGFSGGVAGTFDADFGDFDDASDGPSLGPAQPRPPPVLQPVSSGPSPGGFPGFESAPPSAPWTDAAPSGPASPGLAEDDFDFDFEEAQAQESQAPTTAAAGFAAFEAPSAPPAAAPAPPAPAPLRPSLPALSAAAAPPAAAGGVGRDAAAGEIAAGEAAARFVSLEERLRAVEERARAPAAGQVELEQKLERLSAHVNRRLGSVKTGMKGLHERLQAVEVALARLPDHFTKLKQQQKTQARLSSEHAATLSRLEQAIPALSAAAAACAGRVGELTRLQQAISEGGDPMELLGQSSGTGGQFESGQRWGGSGGAAAGEARPRRAHAPAHAPHRSSEAPAPPGSQAPENDTEIRREDVLSGPDLVPPVTEWGDFDRNSGGATDSPPALAAGAPPSTIPSHSLADLATVTAPATGTAKGANWSAPVDSSLSAAVGSGMGHAVAAPGMCGSSMLSADDFALFGSASAEDAIRPHPLATDATPAAPAAAQDEEDGFGEFAQEAVAVPASLAGAQSSDVAGAAAAEGGGASLPGALMDEALAQPETPPSQDGNGVTAIAGGGLDDFGKFGPGSAPHVSAAPSAAGDCGAWAGAETSQLPSAAEPPREGAAWVEDDDFDAFVGDDGAAAFGASSDQRKPSDGMSGLGLAPSRVSTGDDFGAFGGDGAPAGESATPGGIARTVSDDEFNALFGVEE
jgi:hypothetical protein